MNGDGQLVQVIGAGDAAGGGGGLLHGREQHRGQHGDDGDDHQQFNQGEPAVLTHGKGPPRMDQRKTRPGE